MPLVVPKPPRAPRSQLRLKPVRGERSRMLDEAVDDRLDRGEDLLSVNEVPYLDWERFRAGWQYEQGEHVTIVGPTGSGKTTLADRVIERREYVVVMATKPADKSLYEPLLAQGYSLTENPALDAEKAPRVVFRPKLQEPTPAALEVQAQKFNELLLTVFQQGGWELYGDEIRYLTSDLKLNKPMELLWLQGRSLGISIVVSTQRPVSIPVLAFESATHLFLSRITDRVNIQRAAEFGGADMDLVRFILPRLVRFEFLYIDARTGAMTRTRVRL